MKQNCDRHINAAPAQLPAMIVYMRRDARKLLKRPSLRLRLKLPAIRLGGAQARLLLRCRNDGQSQVRADEGQESSPQGWLGKGNFSAG